MSVSPEYILQSAIVRGIQRMRADYSLIAQLFRNLDQKSIAQIADFIKTQQIDLAINYPRTTLKLPGIVILLRSEDEFQAFLGDSMGVELPDFLSYDGPAVTGQMTGAATTSSLSGNPKTVFGPMAAFSGTKNTLRTNGPKWFTDQWVQRDYSVRIVAGTGKGQVKLIAGNNRDTIMTVSDWLTPPDATSQFIITDGPDEMVGEPSTLFDRTSPPALVERRGGLYSMTYQAIIATTSPEATIALSAILKGIMVLYRQFLEAQGVINFKLSSTDFVQRQEFLPDLSYSRSFNIDFVFPFDVYEPLENLARSFRLVLEGEPALVSAEVEAILSDTSWVSSPPLSVSQLQLIDQLGYILYTNILDHTPIPFAGSFTWQGTPPSTDAQKLARIASVVIARVLDGGALQSGYYAWMGGTAADQIDRLASVVSANVLDGAPIP